MSLVQNFKKVNREEWVAKANLDIKGKLDAEDLVYKVEDGMSFSPFITDKEVILQESIEGPKTLAGIKILDKSVEESNKKAVQMLHHGAEVLAFDLSYDTDIFALFEGIYLDMITVILYCEDQQKVKQEVNRYLTQHYSDKKTDIILISNSNSIILSYDESFAIRMNKVSHHLKSKASTEKVYISVELKKDFLAQIAELRAIRKMAGSADVYIMTVINPSAFDGADIHPLIISNYLIMSAYMGMADVAFGIPYGHDSEMARLCMNIHNILKEESGFNFVTDPTAGAYIIEKLTSEMITAAGN